MMSILKPLNPALIVSLLLSLLVATSTPARGTGQSGSSLPAGSSSASAAAEEPASLLRITGLDPAPGAVLTRAPDSIVATFNKDVLPSSVNGTTFRLVRSGGDGGFGNDNDVVIVAHSITLDSSTQARLDLTGMPLPNDVYQVTLVGDIEAINNLDAELLAMEISGALLPPPSLHEQIRTDLATIRQAYPEMTSIRHRPRWIPGELIVGLTPQAMQQFNNGEYHGLDHLNAQYGPVQMIPGVLNSLKLRFEQRYNPEYLAPLYAAADGVRYAEPNRLVGDGNDIRISMPHYTFSVGWGDCPAGCISRHYWVFSVSAGSVTLVREYGAPLYQPLLPSIVTDLDGNALDGEFSGTFPSGDGMAGGDFVATFVLERTTVVSGQPEITHIWLSNLHDVSATVSWITALTATGQVHFGTDPASLTHVAYDDRGAGVQSQVHHATISGLAPNTTYYFYVVSDGVRGDNNGAYYQFTTGPSLTTPDLHPVLGQVFWSDGTPAADVLVYLRVLDKDGSGNVGQSRPLTGLTDSHGYWRDPRTGSPVNLAAARTEDVQSYFIWGAGDALRIEAWAGSDCHTTVQIDLDTPIPPITLSCQEAMGFEIYRGWQIIVFPALPDADYDAGRLLEDIAVQGGCPTGIHRWMSDLGNWAGHLRGLAFGDFVLRPGEPYFLGAACPSVLRLPVGFRIVPDDTITVITGWNFVALPPSVGTLTAEAACQQMAAQGGVAREIDRWDVNAGNWAGHMCGTPIGDFTMTPGEGYFLKNLADSVWRPE